MKYRSSRNHPTEHFCWTTKSSCQTICSKDVYVQQDLNETFMKAFNMSTWKIIKGHWSPRQSESLHNLAFRAKLLLKLQGTQQDLLSIEYVWNPGADEPADSKRV